MNWIIRQILNFRPKIRGAKIDSGSVVGPGCDWVQTTWKNVYIGRQVQIGRRAWIQTHEKYGGNIKIGNGTSIGRDVVISSAAGITIGDDCLFSYRISIIDHDHLFIKGSSPVGSEIGASGAIQIGSRTFVGANTTILKGTVIGDDCIIGANSLVRGKFANNSVIGGVPARVIGVR